MNTPKTDAVATTLIDGEWHVSTPQVPADFARGLERENASLKEALAKLLSQADDVHHFSSWISMCEYCGTADARDAARKLIVSG